MAGVCDTNVSKKEQDTGPVAYFSHENKVFPFGVIYNILVMDVTDSQEDRLNHDRRQGLSYSKT